MIARLFAILFTVVLAGPVWAEVEIKEVTSEGGIKAWLVEERTMVEYTVDLRFMGLLGMHQDQRLNVHAEAKKAADSPVVDRARDEHAITPNDGRRMSAAR